jgi:spastin
MLRGKMLMNELFFNQNAEQKEIAINLYREGILELERGINIDVWQGSGEKWTKAQRLHDKMQTNLAMAKDRLNFLGEF